MKSKDNIKDIKQIIQSNINSDGYIIALCEDSTVWYKQVGPHNKWHNLNSL